MVYKLLKGHSPFRQHNKNKKHSQDKNEIDKITLTQDIELPDQGFSSDCRDLLEGLLKREVHERLGCRGKGSVRALGTDYVLIDYALLVHFGVQSRGDQDASF